MKSALYLTLLLLAGQAHGASWFEKKVNGKLLYDLFIQAEVPQPALARTFEFLDLNESKEFTVKLTQDFRTLRVANKKFAVIIDYSKPSSNRRLYYMNLETGTVEKYFVAHGVNTGEDVAKKFSNQMDSKQSSLGIFLTGSTYIGSKGEALQLFGLEKSNDRAFERAIVMHGADYVSMDFLNKYGRMGRSWGCPAVSREINKKILPNIRGGAILYAYHKELMPMAQTSPSIQNMGGDQKDATQDSNKIMPEELNP